MPKRDESTAAGQEGPGPVSARRVLEAFPGGADGFLDPSRWAGRIASPWPELDALTGGFRPGQLVVVAGRPSVGKTGLALNVAAAAAAAGTPVALFSLEASAAEVLDRVMLAEARVARGDLRRERPYPPSVRQARKALERVSAMPLYVDDRPGLTVPALRAACRRLQAGPGLGLAVVDCLQLMAPEGRADSRRRGIPAVPRGLKLLARELSVPVIALSQLGGGAEGEGRRDARPGLGDLPGRGAIERHADAVCLVHRAGAGDPRPETVGLAELIVAKQRSGPPGTVELGWEAAIASFCSIDRRCGRLPEEETVADDGADPWAGLGGSVALREH